MLLVVSLIFKLNLDTYKLDFVNKDYLLTKFITYIRKTAKHSIPIKTITTERAFA